MVNYLVVLLFQQEKSTNHVLVIKAFINFWNGKHFMNIGNDITSLKLGIVTKQNQLLEMVTSLYQKIKNENTQITTH